MAVIINDISKAFGEKQVLHNISYSFPETGIVRIDGDSGVGKTTLLRIIAGLEKADSGTVLGGSAISFVFQEHRLFPWLNALENITVAAFPVTKDAELKKAADILNRLGFTPEDMKLYPAELSGGMKQRVSIARAILHESPTLILDEPTKELDPELVATVYEMIREESEKRLVILVTHGVIPEDIMITDAITLQ